MLNVELKTCSKQKTAVEGQILFGMVLVASKSKGRSACVAEGPVGLAASATSASRSLRTSLAVAEPLDASGTARLKT